jgi:hypothetical protein
VNSGVVRTVVIKWPGWWWLVVVAVRGVAMADLVLVFGKGVFIEVEAAKENEDML